MFVIRSGINSLSVIRKTDEGETIWSTIKFFVCLLFSAATILTYSRLYFPFQIMAYDCPQISDWAHQIIIYFSFYVEGVLLCIVGTIGIMINLVSSILILTRKEMRNCFNILLVTLAAFDSWYLFGAILESCRKYFPVLKTDTQVILFPHFLYPIHQTSITGSIFMTVAIAFERYTAVHYPMDYNQVRLFSKPCKKPPDKFLVFSTLC